MGETPDSVSGQMNAGLPICPRCHLYFTVKQCPDCDLADKPFRPVNFWRRLIAVLRRDASG